MRPSIAIGTALVLGLLASPGAPADNGKSDEQKAIDAIQAIGGKVIASPDSAGEPAVGVELGGGRIQDVDLAPLERLPHLKTLDISCTSVTDAGLDHLKSCVHLRGLKLDANTRLTGSGLKHLNGLKELQVLHINGVALPGTVLTMFTDDGVAYLGEFEQLQELDLELTDITDAGLEKLPPLAKLRSLSLASTDITDRGLVGLKTLKELRSLNLTGCKIVGAGLEHLQALNELQTLNLHGCRLLTDEGLQYLSALTNLQELDLYHTQVTGTGLKRLQKLGRIRSLGLGGLEWKDADLESLEGFGELQELDLSYASITDAGLEHLVRLRPLLDRPEVVPYKALSENGIP